MTDEELTKLSYVAYERAAEDYWKAKISLADWDPLNDNAMAFEAAALCRIYIWNCRTMVDAFSENNEESGTAGFYFPCGKEDRPKAWRIAITEALVKIGMRHDRTN